MTDLGLLTRAEQILEGDSSLPKASRTRIAAWYARAALETITCDVLRGRLESDPESLSMASRLNCLRVLDPGLGAVASRAWWSLSRLCHHHAFELTPTVAEVGSILSRLQDELVIAR